MGSRLSQPRGPAGTTESSAPHANPATSPRRKLPIRNTRQLYAPAAAFTMACLLFVYTRTSIRAAKANAQRHRDADTGGEGLNLLNESRRRHGLAERVEKGGSVGQLVREGVGRREEEERDTKSKRTDRVPEDRLKTALRGRGGSHAGAGGGEAGSGG